MMLQTRIDALQEKIGYYFKNISYLEQALTHSSAHHLDSNERMEYLGDRILGFVIAEYLFHHYPEMSEGDMSKRLNFYVSRKSCIIIGSQLNLGEMLILSENSTQYNDNLVGNACEALIAALYFDSNLEQVKQIILTLWKPLLEKPFKINDYKSLLQEWSQSKNLGIPSYDIIHREGPDHNPIFTVTVHIPSYDLVQGKGGSRREAEQRAAASFLSQVNA